LGKQRCAASDTHIGRRCVDGPTVQRCLSAGLWDAGAAITVGGHHVANWLVGQVRDSEHSEDSIRAYAREIGADEEACVAAFRKVPVMAREQFDRVARALFTLAEQLSTTAYQNMQQARIIAALERAEGERDRLHAQLAHAQKMEAVGRLAGGVAHDFNNMLGIILANTEFALRAVAPDSQTALDLAEVRKAAQHSAGLTKQLLAFARKQPVNPRRLVLDDAVAAALQMLRRLLNKSIELSWRPGAADGFVQLDPHQLEQVLANLCVNARDAIDLARVQSEGPRQGHIVISSSAIRIPSQWREDACPSLTVECLDQSELGSEAKPGEYLVLSVADDGCGMDQPTLSRLFEPFFTTKELGRGTGLGLSAVEGIVRQNGGHIRVVSEPSRGTCISLYLPRAEAVPPQERLPEAPSTQPASPLSQRTLLVVEDEEAIRKALRRMLVGLDYEVLCADSPLHALQLSAEHPGNIDLLVTDVVMPELNGQELAHRLRAHRPGLGCLFVSGYTADLIAQHGVLEEGARFLAKPFTQEELAAKVELCLKR
jgi:signal transduction histidine kinase